MVYRCDRSPPPSFDNAPPSYSNLPSYADEDPSTPGLSHDDNNQAVRLLTHMEAPAYDGASYGAPSYMAPSSVGVDESEVGRDSRLDERVSNRLGDRLRDRVNGGGSRPAYSTLGTESYVTTSSYDAQSSVGISEDAPAPLRAGREPIRGERSYVRKPLNVHAVHVDKSTGSDQHRNVERNRMRVQVKDKRGESSPRREAVGFSSQTSPQPKANEYKRPAYTMSMKYMRSGSMEEERRRKEASGVVVNAGLDAVDALNKKMRGESSPRRKVGAPARSIENFNRELTGESSPRTRAGARSGSPDAVNTFNQKLRGESSSRRKAVGFDGSAQHKEVPKTTPTKTVQYTQSIKLKRKDPKDYDSENEEKTPRQTVKLRPKFERCWTTEVQCPRKLSGPAPPSPVKRPSTTTNFSILPPIQASAPLAIDFSDFSANLPSIPDGPSRRISNRRLQRRTARMGLRKDPGPGYKMPDSNVNNSAPTPRRSHQPTVQSQQHSRSTSIVDPPVLAPVHPPETAYDPFNSGRASPTRSWSPSKTASDIGRPPSIAQYEPMQRNGSPRPGSPTRRPLPPAPLFSGAGSSTSRFGDDASISIPLGGEEEENMQTRSGLRSRSSYNSEDSYNTEEREADEKSNFDLYGPAPEGRQERRGARTAQRTKKAVKLINGELILECKIPTILYSFLPRRDDAEFTHMRYTAVTCDPDHFVEKGYKLRQQISNRETELFICVTMYNEDEINFTRTMHAVMKNIAHFCSRSKSRTWGENGWQKIVVCIVSDGRTKIHPRTLDALAAMGVYQDGIAKNLVNQKEVQAHVYEYTTQVSLDSDLKFKGAEKGIVPVQMIFCLKEKNAKKLNSHRWFFNAFGRALTPNICILLDVGTKPTGNSLYHLWKAFDTDSNVAGACGEIVAMKGKGWLGLLNPLVASQNFEYKMSNILDKPLESVFGYITVLPGALSAYRYHALQNDHTGHGPLSQYFKGETLHGQNADVFTANMYLAEDRILCWELVAKRDERWVLKYVKNCKGETDVPDSVPEFVSQRRRWLNGAFFAAVYSLVHFRQIWNTDHTVARKILLHIEFVYQFLSLLFTFFSLANFYLTFYFVAGSLADPIIDPFGHSIGKYIFFFLKYICVLCICTQFILSMGNRPQGAKKLYFTSMVIYGVIMVYTTFATIYIVVRQFTNKDSDGVSLGNNIFTNLAVSLASTIGLYFYSSFLYLDPWHMFTSSAQYFALLPSYICTLQIYAFCNTHDISWGTKGDNTIHTDLGTAKGKGGTVELDMPSEQLDIDSGYDEALRNLRDRIEVPEPGPSEATQQEDYYRAVRTYMVVCWMVANAILAMSVSEAYQGVGVGSNWYLKFLLWSVAAIALFRALGSTVFRIIEGVGKAVEAKAKYQSGQLGFGMGLGGGNSKQSTIVSSSKLANQSAWDKMKDFGGSIADKFGDLKDKISKK